MTELGVAATWKPGFPLCVFTLLTERCSFSVCLPRYLQKGVRFLCIFRNLENGVLSPCVFPATYRTVFFLRVSSLLLLERCSFSLCLPRYL